MNRVIERAGSAGLLAVVLAIAAVGAASSDVQPPVAKVVPTELCG